MTRQRRGFFVTDALIGLMLIVALVAALTAATSRQIRAARQLADEREAIRLAERTMTLLQLGEAAPTPAPDQSVVVDNLDRDWKRISVIVRGRRAELIGRVP